ncbi:hypothetical protein PVAP13_9NG325773 [Panicum virgatum]|uniref:Uncharacterized protein n=1 Tax=Panicum virgatum TaxID=38727 RepID=A0A8T0ML25_PANVG|nr:hypothetical protein PVAP13_9NG325773 [Panicum virgatum]
MAPAGAGAGLAKTHPRPHPRSRGKPARGKTRGWISGPAPAPVGFREGLRHLRVSSTSPPPSSCSRPQPPRHARRSLPPPCWRPPPPRRARRPHLRHRAVYAVGCVGEGTGEIRPRSAVLVRGLGRSGRQLAPAVGSLHHRGEGSQGGGRLPPQLDAAEAPTSTRPRRRRTPRGKGSKEEEGGEVHGGPPRLRRHGPLGVRLRHEGANAPVLPHRARLHARGGPGGGGEIRPPGQAAGRRAP